MKKLLVILLLVCLSTSCTNDNDLPDDIQQLIKNTPKKDSTSVKKLAQKNPTVK